MLRRVLPEYFAIKYGEMHKVVAFLVRAKQFFNKKGLKDNQIILHLPLPLHADLLPIIGVPDAKETPFGDGYLAYIFGIRCVPGYENRIVMSIADQAFYDKSPIVIIEGFSHFETLNYKVIE